MPLPAIGGLNSSTIERHILNFGASLDAIKGIATNPLTIAKPPTRAGIAMRLSLIVFPAFQLAEGVWLRGQWQDETAISPCHAVAP